MSKQPNRAARKKAERAQAKSYEQGQAAPDRGRPIKMEKFSKSAKK